MNAFLTELRRRNVFRVAAAYLVVGWLLIQVTSVAKPALHLPDWTDTLVFFLLALGLPVALLLAWAFEMTPEGMRPTQAAESPTGFRPLGGTDFVIIGLLAVVIAMTGFQLVTRPDSAPIEASSGEAIIQAPADASVAVLPFADLSPAGDQAYFGDGMAEEILNVLTRVDGLHVASRTSAFQFRGDTTGIPDIARALNVRHVVEGSVRKSGDQLRITAQLIDSEGDRHLWSDTFDRPLTAENVFAIQDDIANEIVQALSQALDLDGLESVAIESDTTDLDAYDLFLQAQAIFFARSSDNVLEGISLLERAVTVDPRFARAWALLAAFNSVTPSWIDTRDMDRDFIALAQDAADRATELNPALALPYSIRSNLLAASADWEAAMAQANAAVEREPETANAWYFRGGISLDVGQFDAAAADYQTCLDIDPAYHICRRYLAFAELYRGNTRRATELFAEGMVAGQESLLSVVAPAYFALGNDQAGLYFIAYMTAVADTPHLTEALYRYYTDLDATDAELEAMSRQSYVALHGSLEGYQRVVFDFWVAGQTVYSHVELWSPLVPERFRTETRDRFSATRRQVFIDWGLPAYWRANGFPPQCRPIGADDFECGWIEDPDLP
ncbi:tetratricopeptide repeat protein [Maricaulis maris]|uniref:tetratricopeptide repeat protein n=1 Tax=Maricaulis maris TaxID=74318 RepID=UPI003A900F5E